MSSGFWHLSTNTATNYISDTQVCPTCSSLLPRLTSSLEICTSLLHRHFHSNDSAVLRHKSIVIQTLLFPLLSNRTISLPWKCIKPTVVQQHQSRYHSNASTVTITLLWKCNMVHRSCYQGKPNMSQYVEPFALLFMLIFSAEIYSFL
jgi:hypothetical protein